MISDQDASSFDNWKQATNGPWEAGPSGILVRQDALVHALKSAVDAELRRVAQMRVEMEEMFQQVYADAAVIRAVAAEREACARIADDFDDAGDGCGERIAAAIRARGDR